MDRPMDRPIVPVWEPCYAGSRKPLAAILAEQNHDTPPAQFAQAVNHQLPDRVPIDLGGMKASGIAVSAYDKLKRLLGIDTPTKVLDPRFMIAQVEDEVLKRFRVDVMPLDISVVPARSAR